jgi:hypothetical protein
MPTSLSPAALQWTTAIKQWHQADLPILIQWTSETVPEKVVRQEATEGIYLAMIVATLRAVLLGQQQGNAAFVSALNEATALEPTDKGLALDFPKALNFLSSVLPSLDWSQEIRPVVLSNIKRTLEQRATEKR